MFRNYLKTALRNILKHKLYSFINVLGLGIGLACCLLILLFIRDELSYDRYHANAERIYRLTLNDRSEGRSRELAYTTAPTARALKLDFPEIEDIVRFLPLPVSVQWGAGRVFQEDRFFLADPGVFRVFSFPFEKGDPATALVRPSSLVITQEAARRYFGDEEAMGRTLTVEGRLDFQVTGVLREVPGNSHFRFDMLASFADVKGLIGYEPHWHWPPVYTYLLLPPGFPPQKLSAELPGFIKRHGTQWASEWGSELELQPLTSIRLSSRRQNEIEPVGSLLTVYLYAAIGFLILAVACINFMNLATARSVHRAREVGMRKVVGARRSQIVLQFFGESLFHAFAGMLVAVVLAELALPAFNQLTEKAVSLGSHGGAGAAAGLLALTLASGLIAGSYPALFLARIWPVHVLRGRPGVESGSRRAMRLRSVLVVFQFAVSTVLIVSTLVVRDQLALARASRLGFDKEHVVIVPLKDEELQKDVGGLRARFLSSPDVLSMTACSALPFSGRLQEFNFPVRAEGMPEGRKWYALTVLADHDFVGTMGLKVVDGRDLSRQFGTDAAEGFVLNETAVRELGWEWPVGRRLEMDGVADGRAKAGRVVGVVADFHYDTIHHKIGPVVIQVAPAAYYLDYLAFRVDAAHAARALAFLKSAWAEAAPGRPFEYRFLDESFGQLYRKEERMARFFGGFSVLAIVIGCLGILGLAALSAEKRTKEVGIRKVLGSSTADIAARLTGDQLKGVVLANLIAWPAAYFLMTRWLANFAYRVKLGPWPFLAAAGLTLVVTLIAAGVQGLKAALANPVEALKYE